jgi:sensor histidine kinase regulating citrate/malate metabolism
MVCIESMQIENKYVNGYMNSINNEIKDFQNTYNSENMILDIILNEKSSICEKSNIDFICDINLSKCSFIEMIDVSSIFANILDNAIEACNKVNNNKINKYINIRGTVVKSYYVIRCENSKMNNIIMNKSKFITSKSNKFVHGIGLQSVRSSLEKYGGELSFENYEDKFILKIYIPLNLKNMTVGAIKIPVGS